MLSAGNPQSLNRYAYVLNNPVKYVDPSGHCSVRSDMSASYICMALFILPEQVQAGPFRVYGDNRGFSKNVSPENSRLEVYINTEERLALVLISPSHYDSPVGTIEFPPSATNQLNIRFFDDGKIQVDYDVVISGPAGIGGPRLNGRVTFSPAGNTYVTQGERDGFPWYESYHYRDGEINLIDQMPAIDGGNPNYLFGIEPPGTGEGNPLYEYARGQAYKQLGTPIPTQRWGYPLITYSRWDREE